MATTNPKTALVQIGKFETDLEKMTNVKKSNSYNYEFLMPEIETKMEEFLKTVQSLVKEHNLDKTDFLDFKKIVVNLIHVAAMKRGEYDWANNFEKRFGV